MKKLLEKIRQHFFGLTEKEKNVANEEKKAQSKKNQAKNQAEADIFWRTAQIEWLPKDGGILIKSSQGSVDFGDRALFWASGLSKDCHMASVGLEIIGSLGYLNSDPDARYQEFRFRIDRIPTDGVLVICGPGIQVRKLRIPQETTVFINRVQRTTD
ncbi:hypothetical protein KKC60_04120 [Patescibacteria group bacterium]|nr:hypothetical protein [Patescibacteria group bacterium]